MGTDRPVARATSVSVNGLPDSIRARSKSSVRRRANVSTTSVVALVAVLLAGVAPRRPRNRGDSISSVTVRP